jgi:8-oxo-dGTP pyrophosphatase MutT (NUDIX family)
VRRAAVLVPLVRTDGGLHVVLTRRPATLRAHAGQVALPGGTLHDGEASLDGALREAEEELGIPRAQVTSLGALHDVDTTTGFAFTPWVAHIPADLRFVPQPSEVARVFLTPLSHLADPAQLRTHEVEHRGLRVAVPAWTWDGETIWGATARVLKDLVLLLTAT